MRKLAWIGLLAIVLCAALASPFASSEPDGLQRVARDEGFAGTEREHALRDSPVADYALDGVEDRRLATGLSGAVGVVLVFFLVVVLLSFVRKRGNEP
jgi:cobalt/nickel transport system permease protein